MALTEPQLKYFADFIEKHLGIMYAPQVYYQLEQRLEKVAEYLALAGGAAAVFEKATKEGISGDFKQYLLDISTNNETSFFRDPKVFLSIQDKLLPGLRAAYPSSFSFRVWCAAASFGQEPYSMAMLVNEFLASHPAHPRVEIIATDIAEHALKRCRDAKYTQLEVQRGLPAQRLVKHFEKGEEGFWNLKSEIKRMVDFKKQNLLDPFSSLGKFHIILCRYVLIYQDTAKKKEIVHNLEKMLHPNGYLVFGASESAFGLSQELEQLSLDGAIVYRKKA